MPRFLDKSTGAFVDVVDHDVQGTTDAVRRALAGEYELVSDLTVQNEDGGVVTYDPATAMDLVKRGKAIPGAQAVGEQMAAREAEASLQEEYDRITSDPTRSATLKGAALLEGAADITSFGAAGALHTAVAGDSALDAKNRAETSGYNTAGKIIGVIGTLGTRAGGGAMGAHKIGRLTPLGLSERAGAAVGGRFGLTAQLATEGAIQTGTADFLDSLSQGKSFGESVLAGSSGGLFGAALGGGLGAAIKVGATARAAKAAKASAEDMVDLLPAAKQFGEHDQRILDALDDLDNVAKPKAATPPSSATRSPAIELAEYGNERAFGVQTVADKAPRATPRVPRNDEDLLGLLQASVKQPTTPTIAPAVSAGQAASEAASEAAPLFAGVPAPKELETVRYLLSNPERLGALGPQTAQKYARKLADFELAVETALAGNGAKSADILGDAVKPNEMLLQAAGLKAGAKNITHGNVSQAFINSWAAKRIAGGHVPSSVLKEAAPALSNATSKDRGVTEVIGAAANAGRFMRTVGKLATGARASGVMAVRAVKAIGSAPLRPVGAVVRNAETVRGVMRTGIASGVNVGFWQALRFFDPADTEYKPGDSAFKKRVRELASAAAQPALTKDRFTQKLGLDQYSYSASEAVADKHIEVVNFLNDRAPKEPEGLLPGRRWEPSPGELSKFTRYTHAATNPMDVLANPTGATSEHSEALWTLYPELMADYQTEVLSDAKRLGEMTYDQMFGLAILVRIPLDPLHKSTSKGVILSQFEASNVSSGGAGGALQPGKPSNELTLSDRAQE